MITARLVVLIACAAIAAPALAAAQSASREPRCEEAIKRLDREASVIARRLAASADDQSQYDPGTQTRILIELSRMEALRDHLRCLGLRLGWDE